VVGCAVRRGRRGRVQRRKVVSILVEWVGSLEEVVDEINSNGR
jgi:hypothetical protein